MTNLEPGWLDVKPPLMRYQDKQGVSLVKHGCGDEPSHLAKLRPDRSKYSIQESAVNRRNEKTRFKMNAECYAMEPPIPEQAIHGSWS